MLFSPSMNATKFTPFQAAITHLADGLGGLLADIFHYLTLFAIGGAVAWSATLAFMEMIGKGHASIEDILLLFIYLELGGMVGIYFKTNLMPVRCLIYIAITALSRLLISDIQTHHQPDNGILLVSGAIFLLAISTLAIRKPDTPGSTDSPSTEAKAR